jgi:tetratricopeptide (TPR) repeat protein
VHIRAPGARPDAIQKKAETMTTKRLTKRELREDPVLEFVNTSGLWLEKNARPLLIWVGGAVVAGLLVFLIGAQRKQNESLASEALLKAEYQLNAGDGVGAAAAFQDIQNKYGGTVGATRAVRDQADALFAIGKPDQALPLYQKYLGKVTRGGVEEISGLNGLAACYEAKKDYGKAAETYGLIDQKAGSSEFGSMALWAQGRNYNLAGQYDKAAASFQRIVTEHPRSRYTNLAKQEMAEAEAHAAH